MPDVAVVIFDLGNVIVRVSHREMAAALAAGSADPRFQDPAYALGVAFDDARGLTVAYDEGRLSTAEFYRAAIERMSLSIGPEEFARRWNTSFREQTDVSAIVRGLHGRYRLFLLSNTNELHYRHLERELPVLALMEQRLLSFQLGMRKPLRAVYERVISLAGVTPERIVYIDDIPAYTQAAAQLGVQAITFESAAQLREALRARGVAVTAAPE
ncbi:MAG: HAD family hydrolase [Nitrospirota bacterium]